MLGIPNVTRDWCTYFKGGQYHNVNIIIENNLKIQKYFESFHPMTIFVWLVVFDVSQGIWT